MYISGKAQVLVLCITNINITLPAYVSQPLAISWGSTYFIIVIMFLHTYIYHGPQ